jgi:multiple sugar transport system permease protein
MRMRNLRLLLAALLAMAMVLLPIYWMVITSLLPQAAILVPQPPLFPPLRLLNLHAYVAVIQGRPVLRWLFNTTAVTLGAVAISMVVSVLAGYSLSRYHTRAQQATGVVLLCSKLLPPILLMVPFFIMFSSFGLIDSLWALMLADASVGVPFATWMVKGFFDGIPRELEQAAMIDGCTELGALWRVILPLARPGIAACAVYTGIVTWADFVFARTLVTRPEHWMVTVGLTSFIGEHEVDWTMFMAAGSLSLLPVLLLFLLLEPLLVSGMTQGAVTG